MARRNVSESENAQDAEVAEDGEETSLAMNEPGAVMPATFDELLDSGFTAVKKLKIGDPKLGGIIAYAGQLLGPGEPIETSLPDGKGGLIEGNLPTWIAHPAVLTRATDGTINFAVQERVTHILITPHQLNADCSQLWAKICNHETGELKKIGLFATRWEGKESIKGGARSLNAFSWRERIDALTMEPTPAVKAA